MCMAACYCFVSWMNSFLAISFRGWRRECRLV
jgi:hypothetical protein